MQIYFIIIVLKMDFTNYLDEEKIKELAEYSKRKEEIEIDLKEEK